MTRGEDVEGTARGARSLAQGLHVVGFMLIAGMVWVSVQICTQLIAEYMDPALLQALNSTVPVELTVGLLGSFYGTVFSVVPVFVVIVSKPEVITDVWL